MSAAEVLVDVFLALAAFIVLSCAVGVLAMRDPYQRLHFVGPMTMVAPILVGLAVSIHSGWHENTGETWLALLIVVIASPYLSHATIRATGIHDRGDWRAVDGREKAKR